MTTNSPEINGALGEHSSETAPRPEVSTNIASRANTNKVTGADISIIKAEPKGGKNALCAALPPQLYDPDEIKRTGNLLHSPGDVFQVLILAPAKERGWSPKSKIGYFDNPDAVPDELRKLGLCGFKGVFITLNPLKRDLLARANNRFVDSSNVPAATDKNVLKREWLLIDCDPVRPSGVSATNEEKSFAHSKVLEVSRFLQSRGWPKPVPADSGNGDHLLYRIDIPEENGAVKKCLEALAEQFNDGKVKIDTSVANPVRSCKLYGTAARKGDHCPEIGRPHRMSKMIDVPAELKVVDCHCLEELAVETQQAISSPSPQVKSDNCKQTPRPPAKVNQNISQEDARIRSALKALAPKRADDRDSWLKIGMALHNKGMPLELWDEWSKQSGKYTDDCCEKTWQSFERGTPEKPVTIASIFKLAKEDGWQSCALPKVQLPGNGRTESEFAKDFFAESASDDAFFKYGKRCVMNVNTSIEPFKADAAAINAESSVSFGRWVKGKEGGKTWVPKTPFAALMKRVFESKHADALAEIEYVSKFSLPYKKADSSLGFTAPGYNAYKKTFTSYDAPNIVPMPLDEAREAFLDLLKEFCYLEPDLDRIRTLAYLITPALRLLYTGRPMSFFPMGNRPGVGKDALLELNPLIYFGRRAQFKSPANTDDEWGKLLLSAAMAAEQMVLIGNMKRKLDSQAFEQAMTSDWISGRILGENTIVAVRNIALYAFSGNGVVLSPDMERRTIEIILETYAEDIINRQFSRDIVEYTLAKREYLLNAIYALIQHWASAGFPNGCVSIPSFSSWSRVISGIMDVCEMGNPFAKRTISTGTLEISGNNEDSDFRAFVKTWSSRFGGALTTSTELRALAMELEIFSWLDLDKRPGQTSFGKILTSRDKREYAGFRIKTHGGPGHRKYYLEPVQ